MTRKLQFATMAAVVLLILGAVGAYAVASSDDDEIADGVTIGGVDVSGQTAKEARRLIRGSLVEPLERSVTVKAAGEKFKLRPDEIDVRADVRGMVDEALEVSRDGGFAGRAWRSLTGGEVEHDVEPRIAYSRKAVDGFVEGVAAAVNRDPVDASVEPSGDSLEPTPSRRGLAVREGELRDSVRQALQSTATRRVVSAQVDRTKPEVTTDELAEQYPHYLVVDRGSFELRYYSNLELEKSYTVAIGQVGYDTPAGLYHIENKAVDPTWSVPDSDWAGDLAGQVIPPGPDNPLKARWMGFYNGAGIHGTDNISSLGTAASHGCVRMSVVDVKELYDKIPTGTPIYIA